MRVLPNYLHISYISLIFTIYFTVSGSSAGPSFSGKPSIKQVGKGVLFECKFTSESKPTVTWYHEESKVSNWWSPVSIEEACYDKHAICTERVTKWSEHNGLVDVSTWRSYTVEI